MIFYNKKEIDNITNDINNSNRPMLFEGKGVPYKELDDREFEILSYHLFKRHMVEINKEYDNVTLMQGVGEKGRDLVLNKSGEVRGIVQCKHTVKENRMDRTHAAKEIIKFALNCIKYKTIIPNEGDINYYFVHSFGFSNPAQVLLDNFYYEITLDKDKFKKYTVEVIKKYNTLSELNYDDILEDLLRILKRLNVKKYERQDLDVLLLNQDDIIDLFFQIKKVVEKKPNFPRKYEFEQPSNEEIMNLYNRNFIEKLKEIKISKEDKLEAIKDYWGSLKTLELLSEIEYFDENEILIYEKDLFRKYKNNYSIHCENITEDKNEIEIRRLSRIFYKEIINQNPIEINGFEGNRPFFQNGLYHDMVNVEKIPTWLLVYVNEEDEDEEEFYDFIQSSSIEK